jgi:hypothetical protein
LWLNAEQAIVQLYYGNKLDTLFGILRSKHGITFFGERYMSPLPLGTKKDAGPLSPVNKCERRRAALIKIFYFVYS